MSVSFVHRSSGLAILLACLISSAGCSGGEGDQSSGPPPAPSFNTEARAAAFKLFYRERMERVLLAYNRFALADDAVPATTFGHAAIARQGNTFEVVPGPVDNNAIGHSAFVTHKAWQAFGGRTLVLTLIRLFEGLALVEAVSGHPGLTCREVLPGWVRTMDGVNGRILRTKWGVKTDPPVRYSADLEQEILQSFYQGVVATYREDPLDYYFKFKPVYEVGTFARTYVFSEMPRFLRISDCCSSWMVSQTGAWKGAFWGNHNSRDNFPDLAIGYLAATEALQEPGADEDLRVAAGHAVEAGRRVADNVVSHGMKIMTVAESGSYDDLVPSGQVRPDGKTETQDLGSLASCPMAYLAQALSSQGLSWPVPEVPLPGSVDTVALQQLLDSLGIEVPVPEKKCTSLDDAYLGMTWSQMLNLKIGGRPWYEVVSERWPDLIPQLLGSALDDFNELELAQVGICHYARMNGKNDLFEKARETLSNLIGVHRVLADTILRDRPGARRTAEEEKYTAAVYAKMFGLEAPAADLQGFAPAESQVALIESQLGRPDTSPQALLTDEEIAGRVQAAIAGAEPWIQDRYLARFSAGPPVRRKEDGYEAMGPFGTWVPAENPRHEEFGGFKLWFEAPLCIFEPRTLDCTWAAAGCSRADLDGSGAADAADLALFSEAWSKYRPSARCSERNNWCDRADLDRSGRLDDSDGAFLDAAQGCRI